MGEFGSHKLSASRLSTGPSPAPAGGAERALSSGRRGPQRCRRSSAPVPAERAAARRPPSGPPRRAPTASAPRGSARHLAGGGEKEEGRWEGNGQHHREAAGGEGRSPPLPAQPVGSPGLLAPSIALGAAAARGLVAVRSGEQRYRWGPSREGVFVVPASASPGSASPCSLFSSPGPGGSAPQPRVSTALLALWAQACGGRWVSRAGSGYVSPGPGGLAGPSRRSVPCAPGGAAIAAA